MKTITDLRAIDQLSRPAAIALGTFDGMHIGHQGVVRAMVDHSRRHNLISIVYTFSNHPKSYPDADRGPKRLLTPKQKEKILEDLGVDILIQVPFDEDQLSIKADVFLKDILLGKLNVKHISVGYDFRFGHKAQGNVEYLNAHKDLGYTLEIIEPITIKDKPVSSTLIRQALINGEVLKANRLLGHPYRVEGHVEHGKKMGRQLGFPTANLKTDYEMSVLKPGVYISQAKWQGQVYNSVTNVGFNPTFDQEHFTIETYILDFDEDIYDDHLEVIFLYYLRPEIKFSGLDDLIDKIGQDVDEARAYFEKLNK